MIPAYHGLLKQAWGIGPSGQEDRGGRGFRVQQGPGPRLVQGILYVTRGMPPTLSEPQPHLLT